MISTLFSPFDLFETLSNELQSSSIKTVNAENEYIIEMLAVGIKKSDLNVSYQESSRRVVVSGKSKWMTLNHYINIPKGMKPESFTAKCEDGVLTITIKKKKFEKKNPEEIKIHIN